MRNNLKHKTLLERGGLMIEALAMLGLIAVVTPTMYKKSAERTMEVDDINTATTIRSYVSAAESYMATNYVPLMKEFEDAISEGATPPAQQYKVITNNDLADFLPYKFKSANSLYDYNEPKVTVVKNANNLTAFLLFPAKGSGDDGLGQERTARIASLVGANGGYVRSEHNARGIGGIWSLSGTTYTDVFPSDSSPVYSIVASTPNAINGSTQIGEFENPKYLQRTYECPEDEDPASCTDERWRNTMRTDLYLGGYTTDDELPDDNPSDEKMHNIRNIGSLIVGAEMTASTYNGVDGYSGGLDVANGRYGLYIAENIDNMETVPGSGGTSTPNPNLKSNAYIGGSLMAGLRKFFVDKDTLNYGPRTKTIVDGGTTSTVGDGYNFSVDSETGKTMQYGDLDLARDFYRNDGDSAVLPNILIGSGGDSYSNFVIHAQRYDDANHNRNTRLVLLGKGDEQGLVRLDTSGTYDAFSDSYCPTEGIHGGSINIAKAGDANENKVGKVAVLKTHSTAGGGTETVRELQDIPHIRYRINQNVPVVIGDNTYVQGLLAADQLDTQKLRTASLSTGSHNVDDEYQWLNVDENGVTIESTDGQRPAGNPHTTNTEIQIRDKYLMSRIGTGGEYGYRSEIFPVGNWLNLPGEEPWEAYSMHTYVKGSMFFQTDPRGELALHNGKIEQHMQQNQYDVGLDPWENSSTATYDVNYTKGGTVNLHDSALRVGKTVDEEVYNVLSVGHNGRTASDKLKDGLIDIEDTSLDMAVHGNTMFTAAQKANTSHGAWDYTLKRYLYLGNATSRHAAAGVNIWSSDDAISSIPNVLDIDVTFNNDNYTNGYTVPTYNKNLVTSKGQELDTGSIYIRKGGLDVIPVNAPSGTDSAATNPFYNKGANEQMGFIAAGRFVANNRDASGNLVKVPDMIADAKYKAYNGVSDKSGRYDTYMVNPAYTSVMHDIKLTTRGGARLSDVLPNFIIKAIYISTNDKDDTVSTFKFRYSGGTAYCGGGTSTACPGNTNSDYAASPYTGYVPAPQCPPGYARVLTFTPVSMNMAQAGQLAQGTSAFLPSTYAGNRYHVEENLMSYLAEAYSDTTDESKKKQRQVVPEYRRAKVRLDNEPAHTMDLKAHNDGWSDTVDVTRVYGLEAVGDGYCDENYPMVLTAGHKDSPALPFVFQQNTWLKTLSVPMCSGHDAEYHSNSSDCAAAKDYVNSWALLMGFVYSQDLYNKFMGADSSTKKASMDLYWNVFPVSKYSLEGTATTYCYFNRTNLGTVLDHGQVVDADTVNFQNHTNMISQDAYLSLEATGLPTSYKKINDDYVKRLNDPTLKYTEEW